MALIDDVKTYLGITWSDPHTDSNVAGILARAQSKICDYAGTTLDFETKYLRGSHSSKGMASMGRVLDPDIGEDVSEHIRSLAVSIFNALDCKGVVRIDFMIDRTSGEIYITEINTIPGSLSFYLWEPLGVHYKELLDRMIELALKRRREEESITFSFDTNILNVDRSFGGAKGGKLGAKSGGKF